MDELPKTTFVRRKDVLNFLGVSRYVLEELINRRVIIPRKIEPLRDRRRKRGPYAFFVRDEVISVREQLMQEAE